MCFPPKFPDNRSWESAKLGTRTTRAGVRGFEVLSQLTHHPMPQLDFEVKHVVQMEPNILPSGYLR